MLTFQVNKGKKMRFLKKLFKKKKAQAGESPARGCLLLFSPINSQHLLIPLSPFLQSNISLFSLPTS